MQAVTKLVEMVFGGGQKMAKGKANGFEKAITIYKQKVESGLDEILNGLTNMPPRLVDGIKYAVVGGGKRLRPVMFLGTLKMLRGTINPTTLKIACAIELIHSYSLVHDDLPCMDNDDYRRGKLSTHKMFGDAMGVLIGDGLLNLACEIGLQVAGLHKGAARAMECIFGNAGGQGMIAGQVLDILLDEGGVECVDFEPIYMGKTSSLFCACLVGAAQLVGAKPEVIEALNSFGSHFGVAFQIKDDLEEYYNGTSSEREITKQSLVSVLGDEAAKQQMYSKIEKCKALLGFLGERYDTEFLHGLLAMMD